MQSNTGFREVAKRQQHQVIQTTEQRWQTQAGRKTGKNKTAAAAAAREQEYEWEQQADKGL